MSDNSSNIVDFALPGVQKLVPYVPGKPVEELERELGIQNIVKLASNENPLGTNPAVCEAIQANLSELTRYPDGNGFRLKNALSEKLAVDFSQITLGNGSNEILELVARTFLSVEHEVVFSQHAFAVYPLVTQAVGATARVIKADNFAHDLTAMLQAVNEKTRLVFIANPNNPTGTFLLAEQLEAFVAALPVHVLCVLDEAYYEYVSPQQRVDSISWLEKYPNLIITRTFSKAYGLAGLRVGYSISSLQIADLLNRVRQPFNNNLLALVAAEVAINDEKFLAQAVQVNQAGMQQLQQGFALLGLEWIESAGNFVALNLRQPAMPIYEKLLHKGVIVRPVANYEMPEFLRVSIGTEAENKGFLQALETILDDV